MAEPGSWTPIQPTIRLYAITSAVLAVLFLILLVLYISSVQRNRNSVPDAHSLSTAGTEEKTTEDAQAAVGIPAEPARVTTRTGTIVRITKDEIVFTATMFDKKNGAYVETEMTATTGNDTKYAEVDKTKNAVPVPGQPSSLANSQSIKRSDVKANDQIQVFAADNIQGERRFAVTEVRRLILRETQLRNEE